MNSGGEDVLNVLVSLGVFAAGDVGVGQLIDDRNLRMTGDDGIDIHFLDDDLVVFDFSPGDDFEAVDQFGGLSAAVGFDEADDDVDFLSLEALGLLEHAISFADTGTVAQVDLQAAPLGLADHLQKCLCAVVRHSTTDGGRRKRPDYLNHAERPRALQEAVGGTHQARAGEREHEYPRPMLKRVKRQHQADRE